MAAGSSEIIRIAVTDGDAIETNRLSGKSNTGTYFICSKKDWPTFKKFFPNEKTLNYRLDIRRIKLYKTAFVDNFMSQKNKYPDQMKHFEDICDSLLSYIENPTIYIGTRNNDVRYFMKFESNIREVEFGVRGILYSKLSNIVLELRDDVCWVYPEINLSLINAKTKDERDI